jgi:long-chain acyl-CoA synthetase
VIGDPPSLAGFFEVWRQNSGDFLRYEGDVASLRLSYESVAKAAAAFAGRLRAAGIEKGQRILLWGENRPEWIVALWGCLLEGVVAVPIDFRSSADFVARVAGIVEARALLAGEGLTAPGVDCPVWPLSEILNAEPAVTIDVSFAAAKPDDMAEVLFTSGATGDPKGVTLTHRNILANLKPIDDGIEPWRKYIGPFSPIRFLNLLPLSHMFGQAMAAFIPPMIGGEVWFLGGYNPRDVTTLIRRRRISVLVCVPRMLELLRDYIVQAVPEAAAPAREGSKWYANWWRYRRVHRRFGWKFWSFVVGAAPLDPELEAFWRKLGYVVIQGYGLTETAPIATLNHPLHARAGTVGKAISGVEIRIGEGGEVLLRGENVTPGYYGKAEEVRDAEGWLHTGDIGELDAEGRLKILGRRKEMILSPEGLNVFPEDVERVLNAMPGVAESAAVAGHDAGSAEHVRAVLVLDGSKPAEDVVREANAKLESHQRIQSFRIWPEAALPRTSSTGKLKRTEIAQRAEGDATPATARAAAESPTGTMEEVVARFARGRTVTGATSLDELGLSSLDRIQLMMEIEKRTGTSVGEAQFAGARSVADLTRLQPAGAVRDEGFDFPEWNRSAAARGLRRVALPGLILPLARLFAWVKVEGLENLEGLKGPVIFASNHQSHFDVPMILWALPAHWRYRVAPAMSKEFFEAHFHPERYPFGKRFTNGLNYTLAVLVFNAFPLPQREAGARAALRYAGELAADGISILIFPEGKRTDAGEIHPFQPGVGMLAARLRLPVVPVKLEGLERVLHRSAKFPTPGTMRVKFGPPLKSATSDSAALAREVEERVRSL